VCTRLPLAAQILAGEKLPKTVELPTAIVTRETAR